MVLRDTAGLGKAWSSLRRGLQRLVAAVGRPVTRAPGAERRLGRRAQPAAPLAEHALGVLARRAPHV